MRGMKGYGATLMYRGVERCQFASDRVDDIPTDYDIGGYERMVGYKVYGFEYGVGSVFKSVEPRFQVDTAVLHQADVFV